jgi:uncharacterized glyoxalase superfamily protein PhnB
MHADVEEPGRTIVPTLRYRDVAAAINWLSKAFGFERHLVVPDDNGAVRYAELTFGDGMIMLGPVQDSAFDKLMTQPEDAGGAETQICYLFVEDAGAHCDRAKAAGAEIVLDIEEEDGGGRGYSCRDLEGHIWNFGTYNPWKRQSAHAGRTGRSDRRSNVRRSLKRVAVVAGLLVTVAASALAVEWAMGATNWPPFESEPAAATGAAANATAKSEQEQLARAREGREAAERAIKDVREQLAKERSAKEAAERGTRMAREQLVQERQAREVVERAKEAAERAAEAVQEQLAAERSAREAAERANSEAQEQLAKEHSAKEAAERTKQQAREQLAKERTTKEAAERAAKEAQERKARTAKRPAYRAAPAEPPPSKPPYIDWGGGGG